MRSVANFTLAFIIAMVAPGLVTSDNDTNTTVTGTTSLNHSSPSRAPTIESNACQKMFDEYWGKSTNVTRYVLLEFVDDENTTSCLIFDTKSETGANGLTNKTNLALHHCARLQTHPVCFTSTNIHNVAYSLELEDTYFALNMRLGAQCRRWDQLEDTVYHNYSADNKCSLKSFPMAVNSTWEGQPWCFVQSANAHSTVMQMQVQVDNNTNATLYVSLCLPICDIDNNISFLERGYGMNNGERVYVKFDADEMGIYNGSSLPNDASIHALCQIDVCDLSSMDLSDGIRLKGTNESNGSGFIPSLAHGNVTIPIECSEGYEPMFKTRGTQHTVQCVGGQWMADLVCLIAIVPSPTSDPTTTEGSTNSTTTHSTPAATSTLPTMPTTVTQAPPTTLNTTTAPMTTVETTKAPATTVITTTAAPPTTVTTTAAPTTTVKTTAAPPTTVEDTAAPPTTVKTTAAPPTTVKTTAAPQTTVKTTAAPPTTVETTAAPPTTVKTTAGPPTTVQTTAAPPTTVKTTAGPPTTVETTAAPPTTVKTTAAPPTTVKSTAAPPTTVKTTPASATKVKSTATASPGAPTANVHLTSTSDEIDVLTVFYIIGSIVLAIAFCGIGLVGVFKLRAKMKPARDYSLSRTEHEAMMRKAYKEKHADAAVEEDVPAKLPPDEETPQTIKSKKGVGPVDVNSSMVTVRSTSSLLDSDQSLTAPNNSDSLEMVSAIESPTPKRKKKKSKKKSDKE